MWEGGRNKYFTGESPAFSVCMLFVQFILGRDTNFSLGAMEEPVFTKAAQRLQQQRRGHMQAAFKVIDFSQEPEAEPSFAPGRGPSLPKTRSLLAKGAKEFNIRQARHEVIRFAINNQSQVKNKERLEVQQLMRLGAPAPRRRHRNYKELLADRKNLVKVREQRRDFHQLGKTATGRAKVNCRSSGPKAATKTKAPVTAIDQNYGVVKPPGTSSKRNKRANH